MKNLPEFNIYVDTAQHLSQAMVIAKTRFSNFYRQKFGLFSKLENTTSSLYNFWASQAKPNLK